VAYLPDCLGSALCRPHLRQSDDLLTGNFVMTILSIRASTLEKLPIGFFGRRLISTCFR
jgi:hypothetical protein